MGIRQLRNHIPIAGPARREPVDGSETDMRVSIGFEPAWYHKRCGVEFTEQWHKDPYYRYKSLEIMKAELVNCFPAVSYWDLSRKDDLATISGIFGIYVIPCLYGVPLEYAKDRWPDMVPQKKPSFEELEQLDTDRLLQSRFVEELFSQMDIIASEWGKIHGYLNWQGILNNAFHLRGQDIFTDFTDRPDFVHQFFSTICDVMIRFAQMVQERQRMSGFYINQLSVSNCVMNMISPDMYSEFVFPYDKKIAWNFERFGVHTCNWNITPYIDALSRLPKLGYLDMGMDSDLAGVKEMFPKTRRAVLYSPVALLEKPLESIALDLRRIFEDLAPCDVVVADIQHTTPDRKINSFLEMCRSLEEGPQDSGNKSKTRKSIMSNKVYLISNGDFRNEAGVICWPEQKQTLDDVQRAFNELEYETEILPGYDSQREHGFLTKQCEGAQVFSHIEPTAPVVIVLSIWAYSHHVSGCLQTHKGPILLLANFDGTWPGLVALLNHSATLDRLCVKHSRLWSESFIDDPAFMDRLKTWLESGEINYDTSHVAEADNLNLSSEAYEFGKKLAEDIVRNKRIMGQLDPGCMGMLNAVINPAKLGAIGMPIELLNQSDLVAEMELVDDQKAQAHVDWLVEKGTWFNWGTNQYEELVHSQVLMQMKMYSAAARIYQRYGLSAIGIPYQIGLVRCVPASDLAEGMLNNADRPDVVDPDTNTIINPGKPIVHFNEGDIGSGIPQVIMHDIYKQKNISPETTLHDIRWGREYNSKFVWVFEISGGAPPAHFGGWHNTKVYRQPAMYFPLGGGTCSGICKPGVITWARFYERFGEIGMDCGTGEVVDLPSVETKDRLEKTTAEWPIANVHIPGYDRNQCMATHMSNHITIGYGDILQELVSTSLHLGIPTRVAGDARLSLE